MEVEHLSTGYWVTELDVVPWTRDRAVMAEPDHDELSEFVYGESGYPILAKIHNGGLVPVLPEGGVPANTLVVPSDEDGQGARRRVMIAKRATAENVFDD